MDRYEREFVTFLLVRLAVIIGFRVFTARRGKRVIALLSFVIIEPAIELIWH